MLEFTISNVDAPDRAFAAERLLMLRRIIESFTDLVDQISIRACDAGLTIQILDSFHAALAEAYLSRDIFSTFRCDRDISLTLPTKHLITILRGINPEPTSTVSFSCADAPTNFSILHETSDTKFSWDIVISGATAEKMQLMSIDYACKIKLPVEKFKAIVKNAEAFGDSIQISCDKERCVFKQAGDVTQNTMEQRSVGGAVVIEGRETVEADLGVKYLSVICKIAALTNEITVQLATGAPVFFNVLLYDILGYVRFYVAPISKNGDWENEGNGN